MKFISAKTMAEIDKKAQEDYGISQQVLMENAGRFASEVILAECHLIEREKIAIFCGKGNNGGDGFVVARYLANESPEKLVVYVANIENIAQGAARDNFEIIRNMGLDIRSMKDFISAEEKGRDFTLGIDAIFGTGFKGELPEEYAAVGRIFNSSVTNVTRRYAIDVPSGLDATTGKASIDCLKVHKTISFALPKQGFFVKDGPLVCGQITVKNIGFPAALLRPYL